MAGNMKVQVEIGVLDRYSKQIRQFEDKLRSLDKWAGGSKPGDTLGAAYTRRVGEMSRHMDHVVEQRRQHALVAGGGGFASMGLPAGVIGAGAAGLAGREIVTQAADFESALTEIQKKAGTTTQQTASLGEEIKNLATSGDLAVPISEIAAAYERGAAAGIPIGELKDFASQSVKASDAFGMSAESVGNFAAKLKAGMGMTNEQVSRVFDLTNSLADAGIADESALVDYMDRVGASLKVAGLSAEKSLALGATFLNLGFQAEVASTATGALSSKMLTVGTLTGKARKSFEKVMGPVGSFAGLVEEDFNGALLKLLDTTSKLPAAQKAAFLKDFVGAEWADEMIRLSEGAAEYRRNLALAADEKSWMGSLDTSYKLKLDDFWSQWEIVKNALAKLTIDAGTAGMPAFKAALEATLGLIREVDAGLKNFQAKVDIAEIGRAREAVSALATGIQEMLNIDTSQSPVALFFDRLAALTGIGTGAVNIAQDALEGLGLVEPDGDTAADRQKRRDGFVRDFETINPEVGGKLREYRDWANKDAPQLNSAAEVARERSMDDYLSGPMTRPTFDPAEKSLPADRGGRITAPSTDRFAGPPPQAEDDTTRALRARLTPPPGLSAPPKLSAPPAFKLPDISTVPVPTSRPDIDNTAFLEKTGVMQAALNQIGQGARGTVDIDTSAAHAKLAALRADMDRTGSYYGRGDAPGTNFEARLREQF